MDEKPEYAQGKFKHVLLHFHFAAGKFDLPEDLVLGPIEMTERDTVEMIHPKITVLLECWCWCC